MTNLEFRWLLARLYEFGNDRHAYNSGQIAYALRARYSLDPMVQRLATTKKISSDMDRLFRMGFLSRKRRKRRITTRNGKSCNRGFIYFYRFSKQGISYYSYLGRSKIKRSIDKEASRLSITMREPVSHFLLKELKSIVGPENRVTLPKIIEYMLPLFSKDPFGGRYRRFPPKRDQLLFEVMRKLLLRRYRDGRLITALANLVEHLGQKGKFDDDTQEKTDTLLEDFHEQIRKYE
jgi:hypothetical protein